ncbi:hypothetical protein G7092_05545 [Mucilaginibacter sp. HC2]|uniref:hypothetical protein n=1 Tax=Mucilaginibacter inviolabilis TaxID=2714892 RepID=UPI0014092C1D|nr:hypothetical protein [Mucilaginibacter inviolabilis]NHA03244.1 hypothetical protein [Mucilaginibacter inviolabilis]
MTGEFYLFVENELQKSQPANWQRVSADKQLGDEPCKISHAFLTTIKGEQKLANILILPLSLNLDVAQESALLKLRDYILSEGCLLMVISEEAAALQLGNTGVFISEKLQVHSPDFMWITCCGDKQNQTTFDGINYESLHVVFGSLWEGTLSYQGPKEGFKQVNLEIMRDHCWKCKQEMKTVTGIVFPDRQLENWDNVDWRYYNDMLSLYHIKGDTANLIGNFVDVLRQNDETITPVSFRFSNTIQENYCASSCPYCDALQGNYYVNDKRIDLLHSLECRMDGNLSYYAIGLNIDQYLLKCLYAGAEVCDHSTFGGWGRHETV